MKTQSLESSTYCTKTLYFTYSKQTIPIQLKSKKRFELISVTFFLENVSEVKDVNIHRLSICTKGAYYIMCKLNF